MTFPFPLSPEARQAPASGIVEVANYGRGRPGMIQLWVGEGDLATPPVIADAIARSLRDGETFYTWQRGLPELREALAAYHTALYGRPVSADRFSVTTGGMHAAQIAIRMAVSAGDEVLIPTPAWPNFQGAVAVVGARAVSVPMSETPDGWRLDLGRLEAAVTDRTRAIVVNSPSNPTGWTADEACLAGILAIARRRRLTIIADEIYARFFWEGGRERSASFRDVMSDDDAVVFVQTFSKNWAMTGCRIGWIETPAALGPVVENLVQFSTSGVPAFVQRGALAALTEGEAFAGEMIARAREGRRIVCEGLLATGRVHAPPPPGAFYAFFKVDGVTDTRGFALRMIDEANVGLAPGSAFGEGAAPYLRLCFLRRPEDLAEAVRRVQAAIGALATENRSGPTASM